VLCVAVVCSHGLLDTMTDGGLGVALAWPFSTKRYFAPVRPIPVAPIGRRLFTHWGVRVMSTELVMFSPFLLYALWPRSRRTRSRGREASR
jgi:inner membrane protein